MGIDFCLNNNHPFEFVKRLGPEIFKKLHKFLETAVTREGTPAWLQILEIQKGLSSQIQFSFALDFSLLSDPASGDLVSADLLF